MRNNERQKKRLVRDSGVFQDGEGIFYCRKSSKKRCEVESGPIRRIHSSQKVTAGTKAGGKVATSYGSKK